MSLVCGMQTHNGFMKLKSLSVNFTIIKAGSYQSCLMYTLVWVIMDYEALKPDCKEVTNV